MKLRFAIIVLTALVLLAACSNEDYDTGDGNYSYLRADFVELYTDAECRVVSAMTDDGDRLLVDPMFTTSWITRPDTLYRALLYYNRTAAETGADNAEAVSVAQVPVLRVVPADAAETLAADPVTFESAWLSANGRYLNLGIALKTGTPDTDDAVQTLGVVATGVATGNDGRRVLTLRLVHDQGGVPEYYSVRRYLSIRTSDIDADAVVVSVNSYDGEVTRTILLD